MTATYAELCAGYGGLGLAVEEVFGAELAWYSEFDAAPSRIMAHHWPEAPNHGDMTAINWAKVMRVLILSGGTPCQDLSTAGRRRGMTEGTRSNLWVCMREAIATIKPKFVIWENVRGAYSAKADSDLEHCPRCMGSEDGRTVLRALGRVLGDLSDLGYDCQWRGLRAADVGACHGRFRVFVLARLRSSPHDSGCAGGEESDHAPESASQGPRTSGLAYQSDSRRSRRRTPCAAEADGGPRNPDRIGGDDETLRPGSRRSRARSTLADAASARSCGRQDCGAGTGNAGEDRRRRLEPERGSGEPSRTEWGPYSQAIRRWEALRGAAPSPTELTGKGKYRLSARFTEWMMGLPAGWVTDPTLGISRNEQLKALGNGVVPQQAAAALRDMLAAFERLDKAGET